VGVGEHRVAASADGLRRGVVGRSRGVARGGGVRPGCACGPTRRGWAACVTGAREGVGAAGHRRGPCTTPRRRGLGPIQSVDRPRQPLWGEDRGGGGGGGCGRHPARGPGRTPLLVVVAERVGTPRHATRGLCGGRGFRGWKGRGPSAVDSTPPRAPPKYLDPGQQGNDLSESQGDRIWSGARFFPCGFPNPPTTCLNFSLWRDLSVWRIWGGYFIRWRSG